MRSSLFKRNLGRDERIADPSIQKLDRLEVVLFLQHTTHIKYRILHDIISYLVVYTVLLHVIFYRKAYGTNFIHG